ncbi:MAG TPA: F0F1 ATP synthase subunit gamma [Candidatus Saccharimonadales bacterium]|nr:F0F1 ATP synthase subunit gamma [Candidatus Saccharimonadales bacterium]
MSRAVILKTELGQIHTIGELTQAFEGIASIHIAKLRDRVIASKSFFSELWPVYRSLRIDPKERLAREGRTKKGRNVFVSVTSEGKLGNEVAEAITDTLISNLGDSKNTEVIAVGTRGRQLLTQRGLPPVNTFTFPVSDVTINIGDIIRELYKYDQISVFYQTYESLRTQKIVRIDLVSAVRNLGESVGEEGETISSADYIFEPNINEIADYMESVMMGVAFLQIIMESKLAGYATRFNAMSRAKKRASDLEGEFKRDYYRTKRAESDERLKEVLKAALVKGMNL